MTVEDFLRSIRSFHEDFGKVRTREDRLLDVLTRFEDSLTVLADTKGARGASGVAKLTETLRSGIVRSVRKWTAGRQASAPVRKLSKRFHDRPIIFVFGKVNSGKSTFMNFLVDELERVGAGSKGFVVTDGEVKSATARFDTGVTETTNRIQGMEIDRCLTLIDSPGLHSVTDANEELTKRYTDSADAILWLSPSTSPGQVQELNELNAELERKKPLQPVITKSDRIIETWCDDTQELRRERQNKPARDRKAQEADVRERAQQLGLAKKMEMEIRPVVSISTMAYSESDRSDADWEEAGLGTLFERLTKIVDDARRYKVEEKASQVVRNYIDNEVLGELNCSVVPRIKELTDESERRIASLERSKPGLVAEVKASAMAALERIVDDHRGDQDVGAISRKFNAAINDEIAAVAQRELTEYVRDVAEMLVSVEKLVSVSADELGTFDEVYEEVEQTKGRAAQSIFGSVGGIGGVIGGGAAAGALAGSVLPVVGTVIGAMIGGILGSLGGQAIGNLFVETEKVPVRVGTSTASLMEKAERRADPVIKRKVDKLVESVVEIYRSTKWFAVAVSSEIKKFKGEIT